MRTKRIFGQMAALALVATTAIALAPSRALGDTVSNATAAAYGVQLAGPVPISPRPEVSASLTSGVAQDSLIEVPADPLATSFTAAVTADASKESTLNATLQAVVETADSDAPTKWNSLAHAITEDLEAAADTVKADIIESESLAACVDGEIVFGSAARIVNLQVATTSVTLPAPAPNQVVFNQGGITITFWETNWDAATGGTTDGSDSVYTNALHVIAPGGIDLIVSHSEATAECDGVRPGPGGKGNKAECEDESDNRDSEDSLADEDDPGCHTDGDPANRGSYDPDDDDERNDVPANRNPIAPAPPASAVGGTPAFTG